VIGVTAARLQFRACSFSAVGVCTVTMSVEMLHILYSEGLPSWSASARRAKKCGDDMPQHGAFEQRGVGCCQPIPPPLVSAGVEGGGCPSDGFGFRSLISYTF
jgi:hypothetical protein